MLVLPSKHEGFPHVILEAMASGVPVLVTNVGGISNVCRNEEDILFIDRTPESIANAVLRVFENGELRRRLICNGYLLAQQHTVRENAKKLTAVLRDHWGGQT